MAGEETGAKKSEVRSLVLSVGGVDVAAVRALMARDVPSGYSAQTADEIFDDYWRWFRRFRLMEIVGVLGLAAVALIAGMLGYMAWYFVLLGLAILSAVLFRSVVGQRGRSITEIITQDCDSAKWRRFMELYDARNRRGFVRRRIACNIAAADYADGRYTDAIRRLESISVGERSALWATILNTRALSLYWLGDQEAAEQALRFAQEFRDRFARSRAAKAVAASVCESVEQRLRPVETWDASDLALIVRRLEGAQAHNERASWCLRLAEYELAHGDTEVARQLLDEKVLSPMTPAMQRSRDELLNDVEACMQGR